MLKYKLKGKSLDDKEDIQPYFLGWYASEFSCRDAGVELSKKGYTCACYEQYTDGKYYEFRTYEAIQSKRDKK